jgi:hypothetical protein
MHEIDCCTLVALNVCTRHVQLIALNAGKYKAVRSSDILILDLERSRKLNPLDGDLYVQPARQNLF